jgi:imidazolonepropionase-like amidohydrolase
MHPGQQIAFLDSATSIPARMAHVDQWIGTVEVNKYADIFMMSGHSPDPYTNLCRGRHRM